MSADPKQALRQQCKRIRASLGDEQRQRASEAISARLEAWDIYQRSEVILTYMPMRGEVDLRSLFTRQPEKRWILPRIIPAENHRMAFHPYDPARLVIHSYGMAEPASSLPEIKPTEIQLVLVPGLAYDRSGWRLGYGGGYYDRFLKTFEGLSVGITYQTLLLDSIPHHAHDVPMLWIATEQELIHTLP
jgi:5-formyltetrahydrofolate cyclo-ligase